MIEKMRDYIAECPFLDEFTAVNVNYLVDKVNAYSVNENAGYDPVIDKDIEGNEYMQFLFSFDAKFHWNEEVKNNVDNSIFFERFRDWLRENKKQKIYPKMDKILPVTIGATTNGFIFATNSDEAIYRISCKFEYWRLK